jgi:hypothetical protein
MKAGEFEKIFSKLPHIKHEEPAYNYANARQLIYASQSVEMNDPKKYFTNQMKNF